MRKSAVVLTAAFFLLSLSVALAKPFAKSPETPGVLVGEIASYGDYSLQPDFFETFRDLLTENLQASGKFRMESRRKTSLSLRGEDGALISRVHMDAIARGHQYRREMASGDMIRFAEALMGRSYYQDEARALAWRKQPDEPYSLSPEARRDAQRIGLAYGAEYIVFCNLYDVNVSLNRSFFNAPVSDDELRAKEIHAAMDYYLVHTRTGRVFEGHNETVKRGQIISLLISQYGKGFTVEQMLHCVLSVQAKKTAEKLSGVAFRTLENDAEEDAHESDM